MPQTVKGERFQWFKVDLDMWGTIAPPDRSRFPAAYRDEVYLDIGAPGRCVRKLYVESILDCEGNEYNLGGGVGEHELVSDEHTDVTGTPEAGDVLQYDGSEWSPVALSLGTGANFIQAVLSGNQAGTFPSGQLLAFNQNVSVSGVTNTSGVFTIDAGIYSLNAVVSADFSNPSGYLAVQWYDRTASGYLGAPAHITPSTSPASGYRAGYAAAVIAPSVETDLDLRVLFASGVANISVSGSQAWLYTIGGRDGATGPQGPQGPQGPPGSGGSGGIPNLTFSGLVDVANVVWPSGYGITFDGTEFSPVNFTHIFALSGNYVQKSRTLNAGQGLIGGGTLAADRTFDVGQGTGIIVNPNDIQVDLDFLDDRYQPSGVGAGVDGEHHLKYLASGLTKRVMAREQVLTAFEYFIDEGASLFLEDDGEQVVITDEGGGVQGIVTTLHRGASIDVPVSGTNTTLFRTPVDITVSQVNWVLVGDDPGIALSGIIRHGSDRSDWSSANELTQGYIGMAGTTTGGGTASFTDETIPAGSWVWFQVIWQDAVANVDEIALSIEYSED